MKESAQIKWQKYVKWFIYLSALVPIGAFWRAIFNYSINIPQGDDYRAVLSFLIKFLESSKLKDIIFLMFSPHNEHRILFNRIITLAYYYIFNGINFKGLIIIGNLSLFGLLLVLFKSFKQDKNKFMYFVPVIFLLFQPLYREIIYWAMASLANLYVLFFAFLTIYLVVNQRYFLPSIILAILTAFTNGNGMFVFFVGLGILLYQKRYKNLFIWLFFTIGTIAFYFCDYTTPAIVDIVKHPVQQLEYFLIFIGSTAGFLSISYVPSLLLGIIILIFFIYLVRKKYYASNLIIFSFLIFLFASAFAATLARSGFGIEQACSSKYRIVSILFIIMLYLSVVEILNREKRKQYFPFFLTVSILFNFLSYHLLDEHIIARRNGLAIQIIKCETNRSILGYSSEECYNDIMLESIKKKIYSIPKLDLIETNNIRLAIDSLKIKPNFIEISGWAYINGQSAESSKLYIILKSDIRTYLFKTEARKRPALTTVLGTLNFNDSGFHASIPIDRFEKDIYRVGFYIKKGNVNAIQYINKTVKIEK